MLRPARFLTAVAMTALLLAIAPTARGGEAEGEQVLRDLQGDDFDLRRAAQLKLEAMGESARAILEKAARSGNPEVQATATALLKKMDNSSLALAVYDRDGKPVGGAEAEVKLYFQQRGVRNEWSEPRNESIQTQPNGHVDLGNLTQGPVNVQFEWKKAVRDGSTWWSLELQRGVNPLVLTLTRGGEMKMSVKNDKGEPLRDATVTLYTNRALENELLEIQLSLIDQWDRSGIAATTDKDGVATFESAAEGTYQTVVRADTFLPMLGPVVTLRSGRMLEVPGAVTMKPRQAGKLQVALVRRMEEKAPAAKEPEKKIEVAKKDEKEKPGEKQPNEKEKDKEAKGDAVDANILKKQRVFYELEYIFEGPKAAELQKKQKELRQTLTAYRNSESPETDEQGKLTLEDLKPGRYRLTIASGNEAPWRVEELVIKPGETTDLGSLQNQIAGSVKGKILDTEGKGVQYMNVTFTPESIDDENDGGIRNNFGGRNQLGGVRSVQTQKDGTYEVKNLAAGRYVATTHTRKNQPVRIEGIVVEAGKTIEAPEVRLPADAAAGKGFVVKGTVKLPDGKPAAQSTVNLHSTTFGRWTRNADDKGAFEFSFSPEQGWTPTAISVKAPNCKAVKVDLSGPNAKLDAVDIQLEKQDYGALRVKVTDENGAPLEGVSLRPRQTRVRYNAFNQIIDRRIVTNKAGEARLSGLATGQRQFQLDLEGYYLPEPLTANILSDGEADASVRMKRGVAIRGRVTAGEGLANTIAVLQGTTTRTDALDENGGFEFTGLTPGEYTISAAGPGLTSVEKVKVNLTAAGAPEVLVKAVRSSGAVVALPAGSAFGTIALTRREKNDEGSTWKHFGNGFLDSDGRAEFWGAAPGEYELLLSPAAPMSVIAPYRTNNMRTVKSAAASYFAGTLTVQALKSHEELRALEAVKITAPTANASVRGNISIEPALKGTQQNAGNMVLKLVGARATASVNFNFPSDFSNNAQREPLIFGEKKERKVAALVAPGAFKFTALPAGEYKLFVELTPYRQSIPGQVEPREKEVPVPQQMVVVKDGEDVDLGAIPYTPSPEILEAMRQTQDPNFDTEPEDQIPLFQP